MWYIITLKLTFKVDSYRKPLQNCFKTYKYCDNTREYSTCRWPHFSSIGSILTSITTILTSILTILASIEQVNTPYIKRMSQIDYIPEYKKRSSSKSKGKFLRSVWIWSNSFSSKTFLVQKAISSNQYSFLVQVRIEYKATNFSKLFLKFSWSKMKMWSSSCLKVWFNAGSDPWKRKVFWMPSNPLDLK